MILRVYIPALIMVTLLSACGGGQEGLSDADSDATAAVLAQTLVAEQAISDQPTPTRTLLPPNPTPKHSPTPYIPDANMIFRDDFNGQLKPEWYWENEIPEQWAITEQGWLQITGDDNGLFNTSTQNNLLWMDTPTGNFEFSTHLVVDPVSNHQQAAIIIYGNNQNYLSVARGYCLKFVCEMVGDAVFMEYQINGIWWFSSIALTDSDLYLKLVVQDDVLTAYYAVEQGVWIEIASLNSFYNFERIGLSVSNVDNEAIEGDVVAEFEYFEVIQN